MRCFDRSPSPGVRVGCGRRVRDVQLGVTEHYRRATGLADLRSSRGPSHAAHATTEFPLYLAVRRRRFRVRIVPTTCRAPSSRKRTTPRRPRYSLDRPPIRCRLALCTRPCDRTVPIDVVPSNASDTFSGRTMPTSSRTPCIFAGFGFSRPQGSLVDPAWPIAEAAGLSRWIRRNTAVCSSVSPRSPQS